MKAFRRVLGDKHPGTLMSMHSLACIQEHNEEMDLESQLVSKLLAGVQRLPKGMPVRVAAAARWSKQKRARQPDRAG